MLEFKKIILSSIEEKFNNETQEEYILRQRLYSKDPKVSQKAIEEHFGKILE